MNQGGAKDTARGLREDFMFTGYRSIGEPLNLCDTGRPWFTGIYRQQFRSAAMEGEGLVLGATPWLGHLVRTNARRVVMVDVSEKMLQMACALMSAEPDTCSLGRVEFVRAQWSAMPDIGYSFGVVIGDNSFSYLRFPDGWRQLCTDLASRMEPGAILLARICSVPRSHVCLSSKEIAQQFLNSARINYTEVRATLLFAQWDARTFSIRTEDALHEYESERERFAPLLARFGAGPDNDLETMQKYRDSGAIYYAPPLEKALEVIGASFKVSAVYFGPYAMAGYFPLIVGARL